MFAGCYYWQARENLVIPFNPNLPNIAKREPLRAFRIGSYLALLLENPPSLAESAGVAAGLIKHLYALAVITTSKPSDLLLVITSEQSGPELRRMAKERTGVDQTTEPFLCLFDEAGGHQNLGHSHDWTNQDKFVRRALGIVCERFQVRESPVEVTSGGVPFNPPPSREESSESGGLLRKTLGFLGFGSDPATQTAHNELLEFLSDEWRMKVRYATAFLNVYRDSIAKIHKDVTKRRGRMERNGNAELRLAMVAMSGKKDALSHVLIAQAYNAYMGDLKRGKHVGTDVELAIWAILANRSDILDYVDERFGKWIRDNYERRFPQLFEQVFSS